MKRNKKIKPFLVTLWKNKLRNDTDTMVSVADNKINLNIPFLLLNEPLHHLKSLFQFKLTGSKIFSLLVIQNPSKIPVYGICVVFSV